MTFSQFKNDKKSKTGGFKQRPNSIITQRFILNQEPTPSVDKNTWEGVFASIDKGTYATDYSIGDTIPLDLGSEGIINMQIAAFDTDNLADGSGKAPITWISKELLTTKHRVNQLLKQTTGDNGEITYTEGTGGIGGWEKSELRAYINDSIKPMIPDVVRNGIKKVTKNQPAYDTKGLLFEQTVVDDVWIPSKDEVFGSESMYYNLFQDTNDNRCKIRINDGVATVWWLRDVLSLNDVNKLRNFYFVFGNGSLGNNASTMTYWTTLGFCT